MKVIKSLPCHTNKGNLKLGAHLLNVIPTLYIYLDG